jgi:hypothetical protein
MNDEQLGSILTALAERLDDVGPVDVDLARVVTDRLREVTPERAPRRWRRPVIRVMWPRAVAAALVVLLAFVAAIAFSPRAREAVADLLGIGNVHIVLTPPSPGVATKRLGEGLDLGREVTLAKAGQLVRYRIALPHDAVASTPDQVFVSTRFVGGAVSLVYATNSDLPRASTTGVGMLLTEIPGSVVGAYLQKSAGPSTKIQAVTVGGQGGFWLSGSPHEVAVVDPNGNIDPDTVRLAGNVLLWQRGTLTIRLESGLPLRTVLRIAATVR